MPIRIWIALIVIATGLACKKNDVDSSARFVSPAGFPQPAYHFSTNPVTAGGFELGRKLFYDPILSANNTISCGSCHIQSSAFTQHGHSVSHGIFDRLGIRNSQPIMNLAWNNSFMWDGGVVDLDLQPIIPITNHVEMDDSIPNVLARLKNSDSYPGLFNRAFGNGEITSERFLKALSQFMVMCVSNNSKYDSVMRNEAVFSEAEQQGYAIFQKNCNSCHREPLFTDHSFRNNGLPASMANDLGRYTITLQDTDRYKFKVPSLRNLSFTPPYMHDGRFFTLTDIFAHYTSHIQETPNLDPLLMQNGQPRITLSDDEKRSLRDFLRTLDDKAFLTDKRLAEQ